VVIVSNIANRPLPNSIPPSSKVKKKRYRPVAVKEEQKQVGVFHLGKHQFPMFASDYAPCPPLTYVSSGTDSNPLPNPEPTFINSGYMPDIKTNMPPTVAAMLALPYTGDPRMTETFSLLPTNVSANQTVASPALSSVSSTSSSLADYGTAGLLFGQGVATHCYNVPITAGTGALDWQHPSVMANGGIANASFTSRPVSVSLTLEVELFGDDHEVVLQAMPVPPMGMSMIATAVPNNWPAFLSDGLKSGQARVGSRAWEMKAGERVTLVSVPIDPDCISFQAANVDRAYLMVSTGSCKPWTGWVYWMYGMRAGDRVQATFAVTEEYYVSNFTIPAISTITSTVPSNSAKLDRDINIVDKIVAFGGTAYKWVKNALEFARPFAKAAGLVNMAQLGMSANCNPAGFLQLARVPPQILYGPPKLAFAEEKDKGKNEIVLIESPPTSPTFPSSRGSSSESASLRLKVKSPVNAK